MGTVTFLFADIEGSTQLWDDAPADMADAVRVHDQIVRGTIERHGGYVFGIGGDRFGAAFSTAADAAGAAIESQEQLRDDLVVKFAVRMALHTGEATERDRNYFGTEVNRAARLMSLAARRSGTRLGRDRGVPARTRGAAATGRAPASGPAGPHVGVPGRRSRAPHRVPGAPERRLVPRQPPASAELAGGPRGGDRRDRDLIRSRPLVTLSGVGGVGKTRLALEAGAEVAGEFPDGVWLVELASVGDPASVPAAIASVLGITPRGDEALIDTVADSLGGRRLLLVMDNCEHVVAAAGSALGEDPRPVGRRQDPDHVARDARQSTARRCSP